MEKKILNQDIKFVKKKKNKKIKQQNASMKN
jgi:hypothetical protein